MAASETLPFQAETRQLLDIVIHSLYSNKEIFLRELLSNASDALDKLKLEALAHPALLDADPVLEIELVPDSQARTLAVSDSGIGMTRDELVALIGTIAKSGTRELVEQLKRSAPNESAATLIGQFGVGFYSAFMVANRVEIVTCRAGTATATRWESSGDGTYTVSEASRFRRGTDIILHLKPVDAGHGLADYASAQVLKGLVKKHSDFVAHPIKLKEISDGVPTWTTINSMKPIWTQAASEVSEAGYTEFYHHLSHDWQDPLDRLSLKAEGRLEYQALLFLPSKAPFDMYYRDQEYGLQLHVRRVLIMDRCRALLPPFLRFVTGVVDAADLPLNLSREMVQQDRHIGQMRAWLARKVLDHLASMLADRRETYLKFWSEFGNVIKEGLAQETEYRDRLLKLLLFQSTREAPEPTSLAEYVARMPDGQTSVYYITGESRAAAERSPHLEAFRAKGHEVLYFVDAIDEFLAQSVPEVAGKPLVSVARAGSEPGSETERQAAEEARQSRDTELRPFLTFLEQTLAGTIREARVSSRLTTSPACLVAGEHDLSPALERLLRQASGKNDKTPTRRILEINEAHPLVVKLRAFHAASPADASLTDAAHLLLGSALLAEGAAPPDPASFAATLTSFMTRALLVPILVAVCFGVALVSGQGAGRETRPAFDGIWNSATVTPLERPPQLKDKAFFTPDEAAEWERQFAIRNEDPPPGAPRTGTGTYPTFYREFGTRTVKTLRTSIVTEPADGRIPALTPAATEFRRRRLERMKVAENPEDLGLQDQCLTFLTAGPPLLPYSYNSNYQIVVTADAALIHAEMIHDTRIIHLDGRGHVSPRVRQWMGDSVGRWDGNTLVVDTTNFKAGSGFYGDAGGNFGWDENLHMIERFSLLDADTLLYQFEIDNPTAYSRPWKGELTMTRSIEQMYEFACHEANYSLENMMRGYRAAERKAGGPPRR